MMHVVPGGSQRVRGISYTYRVRVELFPHFNVATKSASVNRPINVFIYTCLTSRDKTSAISETHWQKPKGQERANYGVVR